MQPRSAYRTADAMPASGLREYALSASNRRLSAAAVVALVVQGVEPPELELCFVPPLTRAVGRSLVYGLAHRHKLDHNVRRRWIEHHLPRLVAESPVEGHAR